MLIEESASKGQAYGSHRWQVAAKRGLDIAVAIAALVLLLPGLLLIALIVRLDSPGAPIHLSRRVGMRGREFWMYKLRSMYVGAEARLAELRPRNLGGPLMIRIPGDPRITRVGRGLRLFGLDEIPQLWNVLKGDMSLVGPRPWAPEEVSLLAEADIRILQVRPGMTGVWQVEGWEDPNPWKRLSMDLAYVDNWSLQLDLRILLRTPLSLLKRRCVLARPMGARTRGET